MNNAPSQIPVPSPVSVPVPVPLPAQLPDADARIPTIAMEKPRRHRFTGPWVSSLLTYVVALLGLGALFGILHSYMTRQLDPRGCKTPRMMPTYIKLEGFDTEHTRFSKNYALYLYRERGVDAYDDDDLGLKGVPVLFLPGNAGSYRQGRSLASEASIFYRDVLQHDQEKLHTGVRGLDFFLADFNEDMAAFHGQTLLDQAEYVNDALAYILSLYQDPRRPGRDANLPDPSSVILVGHSMGGIVARAVLTMSNYQPNTVNSIITMSTPHARPPVSFDADIVATYKQINDYWRKSYLQKWANNNPLWHVTLISIAGGSGDSVVPSDYTSLASLVPDTHGFTVFTTTMPGVWTGVDHLSIAWCDAFRKAVIQALYDVVDVKRSTQTKPRAERMTVFKRRFLTGLEEDAEKQIALKAPDTLLTLSDSNKALLRAEERLVIRGFGRQRKPRAHLLPVPGDAAAGKTFSLLTNQVLDGPGGYGKAEVLLCTSFPLQRGVAASQLTHTIDLSQGSSAANRFACKAATEDVIKLPASTHKSKHPFDDAQPFSYLQYKLEDLAEFQFVVVVEKADKPSDGWLLAEFFNSTDGMVPSSVSLRQLLTKGLSVTLPPTRPMVTEIKVPALHSSLLAYRLKITHAPCASTSKQTPKDKDKNKAKAKENENANDNENDPPELFAPMIRQYLTDPYESKYFVNAHTVDVNLHGTAPYMPPHLRGLAPPVSGLTFQLWSDPTCPTPLHVRLDLDLLGSMGKLTMGYRTIFASFMVLLVALVLRKQFQIYDATGLFVSFFEALDRCVRSTLPVLLVALTLLFTSFSAPSRSVLANSSPAGWLGNSTGVVAGQVDYGKNDILLGSPDSFFWFLVPLFGVISVGACFVTNLLVLGVTEVLCLGWSFWVDRGGYIKHEEPRPDTPTTTSASRNRIINAVVLLLLVATLIPYQFAYAVVCIVQLATCVRALHQFRETRLTPHYNFYNYAHSILVLMLWILPINAVVLLVWVRYVSVHWLMPFTSHHNILSVLPYMLLVEALRNGSMVPRITTRLRYITSGIFFFLAVYSALYGVTYAYRLHHIVNAAFAWLVALHFSGSGWSVNQLDQTLRSAGLVDEKALGRGKKLP